MEYADVMAGLRAAGAADVQGPEILHDPCATFRAPGGQRLAVYELRRPDTDRFFAERVDD